MTYARPLLPLLALLASAPLARDLGGLDLSLRESDIEPSVTIRERENRVVEEFRVNNNLYMIRITPRVGAPYYLIDPDGSGDMAWSRGPARVEQRVPQWALFSW
ncbi:MAG: DUF2782 domain-containing protein [Chromatiaceae bacterium]|jgi:hypothetical protein|nr:DUF2782 domain-containing protein [Chromatiaceae bacterium]